ncbi:MAG: helix-turn-helix domain-containing protein [Candidatus Omnitrophota bacterium]
MSNSILTVAELADYLKMKVVTIYKHAQEGKIPAFKVGSKWRFKKETIDKWIEGQEKKVSCTSSFINE